MLTLRDIHKRYASVVAVDGLSLEVRPGEIFGLLGPNGAGKTTTISIAAGLIAPDTGEVSIGASGPPTGGGARRRVGLAPQAIALYEELSARENLEFFARLSGVARGRTRASVDAALEMVGLSDRARDRVASYSGGMKRRANLAAALVHDPPLVILDEPTAGVDPHSRRAILDLVRSLRDRGGTVIYTTHYMEEAQRLCDRVAIIDRGRLLALGAVDDLVATHGGGSLVTIKRSGRNGTSTPASEGDAADDLVGEAVFATEDPIGVLVEQLRAGDVTNVRIDRPDLEAVFLNLTGRRLRD